MTHSVLLFVLLECTYREQVSVPGRSNHPYQVWCTSRQPIIDEYIVVMINLKHTPVFVYMYVYKMSTFPLYPAL